MSLTNANPDTGDVGARQDISRKDWSATNNQHRSPVQALRAELTGANQVTAADITVTGSTPVLLLCKQLLSAGMSPDEALEVWRGSTLALRVRSIGDAAGLEIAGDGVGFRRAREPDAAPLVRQNRRVAL